MRTSLNAKVSEFCKVIPVTVCLLGTWAWPVGAQSAAAGSPAPSAAPGQTAADNPPAATDQSMWSTITFGATFEGYYQYNWNKPADRVIPLRAYDSRSNSFSIQQAALASEYKFSEGFLARAEFRRDFSNQAFFAARGAPRNHQNTALVGVVWWIGNKTGSW